jgi:lipid-binding SYLF domain-containing protein
MKKALLIPLICLLAATGGRAAPTRPDLVARVETCEAIIRDFMGNPATAIPQSVLGKAHALIIVNQFKVGLVFGIKGGYGVVLVKKSSGHWSLPVLVSADEASFGLQLGAKSVETVYVITDDATVHKLFSKRFSVGVDAKAVAGPSEAQTEREFKPILGDPVLVYTSASGLYAGATVKGGYLARDDDSNFTLYNTHYTLPELLYSDWVQPPAEVQPLINYISQIAP